MNACDESVAAATERTRAARPSPPLAAEVPQQPLTQGNSLGGSSLDYWLLSKLRSLMGNPPVEFAMGNGARVGSDAAPVARVTFASRATLAFITADPWLRFGDAYSDGSVAIEGDLNLGGLVDDVIVAKDETFLVDDYARAQAAFGVRTFVW